MATKKQAPGKIVKAAAKPAAKKPAKPAAKKVTKPAPAKKVAPKKAVAKAAPKKAAKPVKKVIKAVAKKAVVKKAVVKKAAVKKAVAKKVVKLVIKKPVVPAKAVKPAIKPMTKKEEIKKPIAKAPVAKPVSAVKEKDIKVPAPKAVVMPKITTKTSRKYQPDFTKSVLDKAKVDPGAPSLRYSDNELIEFRELIQRKLEAAKKELSYLQGLITRKDEMGGDEGDNRYMTMEDGSLSMEREQLSQMASRQITFIDHLEKALMRIENKTYGICRVTGKLIDKARLRAVPHATLSIEAKMGTVK